MDNEYTISTHVPHAGHDGLHFARPRTGQRFQLTCPMRGTTHHRRLTIHLHKISTHVPHAGHDYSRAPAPAARPYFNSRAPCGARRSWRSGTRSIPRISTHVPHAGHDRRYRAQTVPGFISTHVPHAGHDGRRAVRLDPVFYFNSRAPCGARRYPFRTAFLNCSFQLTCPVRGTTE